ncbi:hypothetical protein Tco_1497368, partial [Tanacetum coccineum]
LHPLVRYLLKLRTIRNHDNVVGFQQCKFLRTGYAVSNGSGYVVLICYDEYAVLDRELDTPYPMEVDTPYSIVNQNSVLAK